MAQLRVRGSYSRECNTHTYIHTYIHNTLYIYIYIYIYIYTHAVDIERRFINGSVESARVILKRMEELELFRAKNEVAKMLGDILDVTDGEKPAGMYVCMYVCLYVCMLGDILDVTDGDTPSGMYVCMHVCVYVCMYV
jgi:hypothetical protein